MIQLSFAFLSTAWAAVAAALVDHPALQPSLDVTPETCMAITGAFVATNFLVSLSELTFRGRIAVVASLAQIPLFCVLHVQLFNLDPSGYAFESPPHWLDWIVLTAVHLARAVDILDAIDEPGKLDLGFLNLEAVGLAPRLLMVWMHLSIDLFVGSFLGNWLASRYLRSPAPLRMCSGKSGRHRRILAHRRRNCKCVERVRRIAALGCIALVIGCAVRQRWSLEDCFLWPLANTLKTIDFPDVCQTFNWRLHHVDHRQWFPWLSLLAVSFRFVVGAYVATWLFDWWILVSRGRLATVEELVKAVQGTSPELRLIAAEALGRLCSDAEAAVPALCESLSDPHPEVRQAVAKALLAIHPRRAPILDLIKGLDHEDVKVAAITLLGDLKNGGGDAVPDLTRILEGRQAVDVRAAAATALGKIGWRAKDALPVLLTTAAYDADPAVRSAAETASTRIRADVALNSQRLAGLTTTPPPVCDCICFRPQESSG